MDMPIEVVRESAAHIQEFSRHVAHVRIARRIRYVTGEPIMSRFVALSLAMVVLVGCSSHHARRQAFVDANPGLPQSTKSRIMKGEIWGGMTRDQLIACRGEPKEIEVLLDDTETSMPPAGGSQGPLSSRYPSRGLAWSIPQRNDKLHEFSSQISPLPVVVERFTYSNCYVKLERGVVVYIEPRFVLPAYRPFEIPHPPLPR